MQSAPGLCLALPSKTHRAGEGELMNAVHSRDFHEITKQRKEMLMFQS